MRSPLWALAAGVAGLLVAASYWGHFLYVPGPYRALPWAHLVLGPALAAAAVVVARRVRGDPRWPRRAAAWIGAGVAGVAAAVLWLFLFVGARLPVKEPPRLERAPEVTLLDQDGTVVRLAELTAGGPVVVAFFRGGFDAFGRAALADLESRRARVEAAGGRIVAVAGDAPAELRALRARLGLGYPLLSDDDLAAAASFGVRDAAGGTARPAWFVVARDGRVAWMHFARSGRDLPHPDEIARQVESLSR